MSRPLMPEQHPRGENGLLLCPDCNYENFLTYVPILVPQWYSTLITGWYCSVCLTLFIDKKHRRIKHNELPDKVLPEYWNDTKDLLWLYSNTPEEAENSVRRFNYSETLPLLFDIDSRTFVQDCLKSLTDFRSINNQTIIAEVVGKHFLNMLQEQIKPDKIIRYNQEKNFRAAHEYAVYHETFKPLSLNQLTNLGDLIIAPVYFNVVLSKKEPPIKITITPPENLKWTAFKQLAEGREGFYIHNTRIPITQIVRMKKIDKYKIRLHGYVLPKKFIEKIKDAFPYECSCPIEYLMPYTEGEWSCTVSFICRVCGKKYYCSCFEKAFIHARRPTFNAFRGVNDVPKKRDCHFREGICHLCRNRVSDLAYCSSMYGNILEVNYGAYITKIAAESNISYDEAETELRVKLGIPKGIKWVSEFRLFMLVRDILRDIKIYYQASPEWLGNQYLDIFIPDLGLAIEYQGKQHYEPIEIFGGGEGFKKTKESDKRKQRLCKENNIDLVYFKYSEDITEEKVSRRLEKYINK